MRSRIIVGVLLTVAFVGTASFGARATSSVKSDQQACTTFYSVFQIGRAQGVAQAFRPAGRARKQALKGLRYSDPNNAADDSVFQIGRAHGVAQAFRRTEAALKGCATAIRKTL